MTVAVNVAATTMCRVMNDHQRLCNGDEKAAGGKEGGGGGGRRGGEEEGTGIVRLGTANEENEYDQTLTIGDWAI